MDEYSERRQIQNDLNRKSIEDTQKLIESAQRWLATYYKSRGIRRTPGHLHTSSDGQKFEVQVDSLNANYSFKYFGSDQGVSVYTFRDERDLLWLPPAP